MSISEYCNRELVIVSKTESVREAIYLMRKHHVGDVVIVDKQGELLIPVGILTDRDIVIEILAEGVDLDTIAIGDVMSYQLVTVVETTSLMDTIKVMRDNGVRRLPVVNTQGGVVGIVTVDDLLELITEQLHDIVSLLAKEQLREHKLRN
jgi:CBS domain-containing protein